MITEEASLNNKIVYYMVNIFFQMLQEFLERSAIQADVSLLCWEDFFTEVVLNFETAQHHSFLLNFLEGVANAYERSDRPDEYIYDLMKLNVSNLLSGQCNCCQVVH